MRLPVISVTVLQKWGTFTLALLVAKGPSLVELMTGTPLAPYIHIVSMVCAVAGFLTTLQIHPTPVPSPPVTTPTLPVGS